MVNLVKCVSLRFVCLQPNKWSKLNLIVVSPFNVFMPRKLSRSVRSFVRSLVVHRLNGSKPLGTDSHNCSAHFARSPQIHQIPGLCIFYGGVHTQHMSAKWGELLTDPQIINFCRTLFMPPFGKHIGTPTT